MAKLIMTTGILFRNEAERERSYSYITDHKGQRYRRAYSDQGWMMMNEREREWTDENISLEESFVFSGELVEDEISGMLAIKQPEPTMRVELAERLLDDSEKISVDQLRRIKSILAE